MKHPYFILPDVLPDIVVEDIKNIVLNYEEIDGGVGGNVTLQEEAKVNNEIRRCKQRWFHLTQKILKKYMIFLENI